MVEDCFPAENIAPLHFRELSQAATTIVQMETGEQKCLVGSRGEAQVPSVEAFHSFLALGRWEVACGPKWQGSRVGGHNGIIIFF